MVNIIYLLSFVETPRKFIIADEGPATGEISYTRLRNPRKSTEMKSEIKKSREKSVNFQIRNHLKLHET